LCLAKAQGRFHARGLSPFSILTAVGGNALLLVPKGREKLLQGTAGWCVVHLPRAQPVSR
jgi:hypothetical protein